MSKVHVLLVTDMSGSMYPLAADVRGGYNTYLDDLASDSKFEGEYRVTSVLFNSSTKTLCIDAPLAEVPRLDECNYRPSGNTALLDAIGNAISDFEAHGHDHKDRVMLFIATDGQENSSQEYTWGAIKKMTSDRTGNSGNWAVTYVGAGVDEWHMHQSRQLGIQPGMKVNTVASSMGIRSAYTGMTFSTRMYAQGGSAEAATQVLKAAVERGDDDPDLIRIKS